jgi:hypothetical protein
MEDDQLMTLAKQFVEIKVPFIDKDYQNELATEVRAKIEETINLELISAMDAEQADSFRDLLEKNNSTEDDIMAFINKCNIDINIVTSAALTKFRIAYLGA